MKSRKWKMYGLFAGIGGFEYAAQEVWGDELEIVGMCEIDSFCRKVLKKHWPNVAIHEDIRSLDGNEIKERFGAQSYMFGGTMKYFSYHPEEGFELHETAEEAKKAADISNRPGA